MEQNESNISWTGSPKLACILCAIIAVLCIGFGTYVQVDQNHKLSSYESATGVVVEYTDRSPGSNAKRRPVYEYEVNGTTYRYIPQITTSEKARLGQSGTIYYNPSDPQEAMLKTKTSPFFVVGAFFAVFAIFIVVSTSQKIRPTVRGFIMGLLFGALFAGISVYGLFFITGLNIIIRVILVIILLIGVFIIGETFYRMFSDKNDDENQVSLNTINDSLVSLSVSDRLQNISSILRVVASIITICIFIGFVVFTLGNRSTQSKTKDGRTILDSSYIAKVLKCNADELPEYLVYERKVIAKGNGIYYFEQAAGVNDSVRSSDEYQIGETVYWIEVMGDYPVILCDMDDYSYDGTNTPANSSYFDATGKRYLDDDFIREYAGAADYEIIEVTFVEIDNGILIFKDYNNVPHSLSIPSENLCYYEDAKEGDTYFWISLDNSAFVLDADLYTYPV